MLKEELTKVLELHRKWLNNEPDGERAYLEYANLFQADLEGADLRHANLRNADLRGADLYGADLRHADLCETNLRRADLEGADLEYAILYGATLRNTNLRYAILRNAGLEGADLESANLGGADLRDANLRDAGLRGTDLRGADLRCTALRGSDLRDANLRDAVLDDKEMCRLGIVLKEDRVGYKKLRGNIVCKILVPKGAIVFSINNSKCRTNKCIVLENGGVSPHYKDFIYEVGKEIEIDNFNLQYNVECGAGIHFFWTEEEARNYQV
jgi:hypothetical protein